MRICEMTMNILESLLNIGIIPNKKRVKSYNCYKLQTRDVLQQIIDKKEEKYAENFGFAINIILRFI